MAFFRQGAASQQQGEGRRRFAVTRPRRLAAVALAAATAALLALLFGGGYSALARASAGSSTTSSSLVASVLAAAQSAAGYYAGGNTTASTSTAASGSALGVRAASRADGTTWADSLPSSEPPEASAEQAALHNGLACERSGYCSLGRVGPHYVGEADSTQGLRAALTAAAFKREVIMITIGDTSDVLGFNLLVQLWRLGIAHVILLGRDAASCERLQTAGYRNVTCVWSRAQWFPRSQYVTTDIWSRRVLLAARIVWHGFNLWNLDADVFFFHDPYQFVKAEPFKGFNHIALHEGGPIPNGGCNYIQNARLDGAEAWLIAAAAERIIAVNENWAWVLQQKPDMHATRIADAMADQEVMGDMAAATKLGHPTLRYTLRALYSDQQRAKVDGGASFDAPGVDLKYPKDWEWIAHTRGEHVPGWRGMRVPWVPPGNWSEDLGWKQLPTGNATAHFIKHLEEESGARFFNVTGEQPPPDVPPDSFLMAPGWLVGNWLARGFEGRIDQTPPQQVIYHVVWMGAGDAWPNDKKIASMKAFRAFDYRVPEALEGKLIPAVSKPGELPKVLAFAPGLRILTQTEVAYRAEIARLIRLAMRLGRVLLVPEPFCNSPWIADKAPEFGIREVEGHKFGRWDPARVLDFGLDDDRHCIWWPLVETKGCHAGAYTLQRDFEALLAWLPPEEAKPTPANTLWHELWNVSLAQAAPDPTLSTSGGLELVQPGAAVLEAVRKLESQHVVYLGAPLRLVPDLPLGSEAEEAGFRQFNSTCRWMGPKFMGFCNGLASIGARC